MKNKYIIPEDVSSTMIERASKCCGGSHQTIAGALLKSKLWDAWYRHASENMIFDVDETMTIDAMSDEHFDAFMRFCSEHNLTPSPEPNQ